MSDALGRHQAPVPTPPPSPGPGQPTLDQVAQQVNAADPETFYRQADAIDQVTRQLQDVVSGYGNQVRNLEASWTGTGADAHSELADQVSLRVNELVQTLVDPSYANLLRQTGQALAASQQQLRALQDQRSAAQPAQQAGPFPPDPQAIAGKSAQSDYQAQQILRQLCIAYEDAGLSMADLPQYTVSGNPVPDVVVGTPPPLPVGSGDPGWHTTGPVAWWPGVTPPPGNHSGTTTTESLFPWPAPSANGPDVGPDAPVPTFVTLDAYHALGGNGPTDAGPTVTSQGLPAPNGAPYVEEILVPVGVWGDNPVWVSLGRTQPPGDDPDPSGDGPRRPAKGHGPEIEIMQDGDRIDLVIGRQPDFGQLSPPPVALGRTRRDTDDRKTGQPADKGNQVAEKPLQPTNPPVRSTSPRPTDAKIDVAGGPATDLKQDLNSGQNQLSASATAVDSTGNPTAAHVSGAVSASLDTTSASAAQANPTPSGPQPNLSGPPLTNAAPTAVTGQQIGTASRASADVGAAARPQMGSMMPVSGGLGGGAQPHQSLIPLHADPGSWDTGYDGSGLNNPVGFNNPPGVVGRALQPPPPLKQPAPNGDQGERHDGPEIV